MKVLILAMLLTVSAWAAPQAKVPKSALPPVPLQMSAPKLSSSVNMACVNARPYTEVSANWDPAVGLTLNVISEGGIETIPLYDGLVTKGTLDFLTYQAEDLKSMPRISKIFWSADKCKVKTEKKPWLIECGGVTEKKSDFPYDSTTLFTYNITQESATQIYEMFKVSWSVTTDSTTYFLAFVFDPKSCF